MAAAPYLLLAISAISAVSQIGSGVAEKRQADADADLLKKIGKIEAETARRQGRRLTGRQRVALAKSGVDVGLGTPLAVLGETAFEAELEAQRRYFYRRTAAKRREQYGKQALWSGVLGGASTLLGGVATASSSGMFSGGSGAVSAKSMPTDMGTPSRGWY